MLTAQKYSLLIPTFNRPRLLDTLLGYLAAKKAQFPIFVLDSSSDENKIKNQDAANRYDLDLLLMPFDTNVRFDFKVKSALQKIDSDYVSLCADDDIVFIDAIEACIGELDSDTDLAACHGVYLNFSVTQPDVEIRVEYASPSIDADNAIDRACQLLTRYEALNYAVYRRAVMADVFDALSLVPENMFWELFSGLAPVMIGKVKRLPRVYHARRAHGRSARTDLHPATWIAADPDQFVQVFAAYRELLFAFCDAHAPQFGPEAKKRLTLAHAVYCFRALGDGAELNRALTGTPPPVGEKGILPAINSIIKPMKKMPVLWLLPFIARRLRQGLEGDPIRVIRKANKDGAPAITASRHDRWLLSKEMIDDLSWLGKAWCKDLTQ